MIIRGATSADLPRIVSMIADDFLGAQRENYKEPLPESYLKAFQEIDAEPNNEVRSNRSGQLRGKGIGRKMMLWAIERSKEKTASRCS